MSVALQGLICNLIHFFYQFNLLNQLACYFDVVCDSIGCSCEISDTTIPDCILNNLDN